VLRDPEFRDLAREFARQVADRAVFDLERDGRIEVLAQPWLGPTRLVQLGGPHALLERESLEAVPFFGCPC